MKRTLCLVLTLTLCIGLCACIPKAETIVQPVNFYYRMAQPSYGTTADLISAQLSESVEFDGDTVAILNEYLKGPDSDRFEVTFPAGTQVLSLTLTGGTAYLQLNDNLALLSGIDLTIACACITKTVMELTGATAVCISADNVTLDGVASITMDAESLLRNDHNDTAK